MPPPTAQTELPTYDAPLLSVRAVSSVLMYFEQRYGRAALEAALSKRGITQPVAYFGVLTNFISLHTCEDVLDALAAASDSSRFMHDAGMGTASPEALGFMFHVLRAVGNPRLCYEKLVELNANYNRIGRFELAGLEKDHGVLRYTSGIRERNRNICELRMGQFASFPTIWGLPPAEIHERACHVRGDAACEYELRWQNPPSKYRRWAGLLLGTAVGSAAHWAGHADPLALASMAVLGGAAGAALDLRAELRDKDASIHAQNEGLTQSLVDLTRRHEEMTALNRELDARVTQRTQDLAQANTDLQAALERAKEVDRLKTEFFDNVGHELRTPVSLMLLALEALLRGKLVAYVSPEVRGHLETMERSFERLLRLINQLLDLAKIEAGKMRLRYQPIDLGAFLQTLCMPFRIAAEQKGIELELDAPPTEPISADAEKLDVVFQNLLANALKFTAKGGKVIVRVREDEKALVAEVVDTGVGIPQDDLPRIFDRFAQADGQSVKRIGGTGIGLALVKELVELHEGGIVVESAPGKGSTFRVTFPKGEAHVREELRERRAPAQPGDALHPGRRGSDVDPVASMLVAQRPKRPTARPQSSASLRAVVPAADRRAVLLVEDDPDLRAFVASALEERYAVVEAENGVRALEALKTHAVELIISDVMMPEMSGLQLLQALHSDPQTRGLPVILLTAQREPTSVVAGLTAGASDYLAKPFSARELMARVDVQLRLRDASARAAAAERLAALGLLSTGFAHEVRNPLNFMLNAVEPLREDLPKEAAPLLDVIVEGATRVRTLAESLLVFAQPGKAPTSFDLVPSIDSTLTVLGWKVPRGVRVERELGFTGDLPGDGAAMRQVWLNLLDNALRAVGERGTIRVTSAVDGGMVQVRVEDSGEGIDPKIRARLFQPFVTSRPGGQGSGLGLTLCRRIVEDHGGTIEVDTGALGGARFTVRLPRMLPALAALPPPPQLRPS